MQGAYQKAEECFSKALYNRKTACHDNKTSVVPKKRGRPTDASTNASSKETSLHSKSWRAILAVDQFKIDKVFKRYLDADPSEGVNDVEAHHPIQDFRVFGTPPISYSGVVTY